MTDGEVHEFYAILINQGIGQRIYPPRIKFSQNISPRSLHIDKIDLSDEPDLTQQLDGKAFRLVRDAYIGKWRRIILHADADSAAFFTGRDPDLTVSDDAWLVAG